MLTQSPYKEINRVVTGTKFNTYLKNTKNKTWIIYFEHKRKS